MPETIYLGLGSNVGDSPKILRQAVSALKEGLSEVRVSSLWLSAPRYVVDQAPFYNLAVEAKSDFAPKELLAFTSAVEARFGRDRSVERPKGPRSLDIDILLVGDRLIESESLIVPHPGMEERKFVLLPLVELVRDLRNPRTGRRFLDSLAALGPQGIYLVGERDYDRLCF